jgi:3-deoxy-D-manno-octulosonate 8-phosphate phosphatase (KDO 8-P phosphatase)
MEAGIHVAIISGSAIRAVAHRAQQLGIEDVHLGIQDKQKKLQEICRRLGISITEVAYVGDDLTDLPVLRNVGLACAPADAVEAVREQAVLVTEASGGQGAVREICNELLHMRKKR